MEKGGDEVVFNLNELSSAPFWDQDGHRHDQLEMTPDEGVPQEGDVVARPSGDSAEEVSDHWMGLSKAQLAATDKVL